MANTMRNRVFNVTTNNSSNNSPTVSSTGNHDAMNATNSVNDNWPQYYDMSRKKILVIFNHFKYRKTIYFRYRRPSQRNGTQRDVASLKESFGKLGFKIITHNDCTKREIIEHVRQISNQDHSKTSCLAIAIMTHGDRGGLLTASNRCYRLKNITSILEASHPTLLNKPKLILVQACRGPLTDVGKTLPSEKKNYFRKPIVLPTHTNYLVLYPLITDLLSRSENVRTCMVEELSKVLASNLNLDLQQMITLTNSNVSTKTPHQNIGSRSTLYSSLNISSRSVFSATPYYDMTRKKFVFIFNHIKYKRTYHYFFRRPPDRTDCEEDVTSIKQSFGQQGFKIITYNDLTRNKIYEATIQISQQDHCNTSCLVFFILTHSKKREKLAASDRYYRVDDLTYILQNSHKSLVSKPKLLIIPSPKRIKTRVNKMYKNNEPGANTESPCLHFLKLYSTVEGYVSWRNDTGTWMMQELCRVINNNHRHLDFGQMTTVATRNVALKPGDNKQTLETESTLTKLLKF